MKKEFISFIKFGEKEYMEKLFHEGEIYCNPINHFSELEYNDNRTDKHDGADYLIQAKDLKFKLENHIIATAKTGQLFRRDLDLVGNIYCFYGIQHDELKPTNTFKEINLNFKGIDWGDTAVFIYDTKEFLKRIKRALKIKNFEFEISPITYYNEKTYHGKLTPFHKRKELFENQKEIRFWIPNKINQIEKIFIGDISDISFIIPKNEICKIKYDYK